MHVTTRLVTLAAAVFAVILPLQAQQPPAQPSRAGVAGELLMDLTEVEMKIVGLAKAMPESAYEWRPGKGVRSTSEALRHIAADNYYMPAVMGVPTPPETAITREYKTAEAFEKKPMNRAAVIAEVEKSFAFLKQSLTDVPDAKMDAPMTFFGRKGTTRAFWITTTSHLHEHLGQLIAYARSNNVTPPWSK